MTRNVIPGNNTLQVDGAGNTLFRAPHGTFYSLATQAIANTAAVQAIALEKDEDVHGLTHDLAVNNSRIYVQSSGSYELIFSGIVDLTALPAGKYIEVWPAIDGTAAPDSNTPGAGAIGERGDDGGGGVHLGPGGGPVCGDDDLGGRYGSVLVDNGGRSGAGPASNA
jgi:hypothetical protein